MIVSDLLNRTLEYLRSIPSLHCCKGMAPSAITTTEQYASIVLNTEPLKPDFHAHHGPDTSKELVKDALMNRIADIDTDVCEAGEENAFFVADMGEVYRQHLRWKMNLKRVKPHYGKTATGTNDHRGMWANQ